MKKQLFPLIVFCFFVTGNLLAQQSALPFLIGTYTQGQSQGKGIYLSEFLPADGTMKFAELVAPCAAPAFVVKHPDKSIIYSVGETWESGKGPIYSFSLDSKTNRLTPLGELLIPGTGPTHLCVCGDSLVVACYGSGNIVSISLEKDGRLGKVVSAIQHEGSGPNSNRQKEPHPHGAYVVPGTTQIIIPDLGMDKLMIYEFDSATSKLTSAAQPFLAMPAGSGPRHLDFDPTNSARLFVVNELDSTVCTVEQNAEKRWNVTQTASTLLPEILADSEKLAKLNNSTAEIEVHPSGEFVYASNRGHDSIAVFAVEKASGKLTLIQTEPTQGQTPRHFAITPCGGFMLAANQDSNSVTAFRIDTKSGKLSFLGQKINVGAPVCVVWLN